MSVVVYSYGLTYLSACAPADTPREEVEEAVNISHPTGLSSRWKIADEPFVSGDDNPSPCNTDPERQHWLLSC